MCPRWGRRGSASARARMPRSSSSRWRGWAWPAAITITSRHWSSWALRTSSPIWSSLTAALAARYSSNVRWMKSIRPATGSRIRPLRTMSVSSTAAPSSVPARGIAASFRAIRSVTRSRGASDQPLRISQYARSSSNSLLMVLESGTPLGAISRSTSRRSSSMSSAVAYSSIRSSGNCARRSRFRTQSSAHSSGLVASSRRCRRALRDSSRPDSLAASCARRSVSPDSARNASCQCRTNSRTSGQLIGSTSAAVNPWWSSHVLAAAPGRDVITYFAFGKVSTSMASQVRAGRRCDSGSSSTPSIRTSARPSRSSLVTHAWGMSAAMCRPTSVTNSSGAGDPCRHYAVAG